MVCWGQNGEWGGEVLEAGDGEEGEEWGSVELGSVEFVNGCIRFCVHMGFGRCLWKKGSAFVRLFRLSWQGKDRRGVGLFYV